MDYSIINERLSGVSDGIFSVVVDLVASSSETIPFYNEVADRVLVPGSVAIVPSESAIYILDTDLLWTDWGTGTKIPLPEDDGSDEKEVDKQNG